MPVFILYRPNSEHERSVADFVRDFKRQTGHDLELISLNTPEGTSKAEVYDVVHYPAIVATREDGQLLHLWQNPLLPTINEVSGYLNP